MSYCRFANSAAYLIRQMETDGYLCISCRLTMRRPGDNGFYETAWLQDAADAIDHMKAHQAAGGKIPLHVFKRLRQDLNAQLPRYRDSDQEGS